MNGTARWILIIAGGILAAWAIRSAGLPLLLPFAVAWIGAELTRPLMAFLTKRSRLGQMRGGVPFRTAAAILLCGGMIWLTVALSGRLIGALGEAAAELPDLADKAVALLWQVYDLLPMKQDGAVVSVLSNMLTEAAAWIGGRAASLLAAGVQKLPGGILALFVTVVSYVHMAADPDGVRRAVCAFLPESAAEKAEKLSRRLGAAVTASFRTCGIMMILTYAELTFGLVLLGVNRAPLYGLIIAVIDALPVLGCGAVLVPWALWCFLNGETGRAIGLLLLLGVVWAIRQVAEPRIIGTFSGVHPFLTLAALYAGWALFGVAGLLLAPVGLFFLKQEPM